MGSCGYLHVLRELTQRPLLDADATQPVIVGQWALGDRRCQHLVAHGPVGAAAAGSTVRNCSAGGTTLPLQLRGATLRTIGPCYHTLSSLWRAHTRTPAPGHPGGRGNPDRQPPHRSTPPPAASHSSPRERSHAPPTGPGAPP